MSTLFESQLLEDKVSEKWLRICILIDKLRDEIFNIFDW